MSARRSVLGRPTSGASARVGALSEFSLRQVLGPLAAALEALDPKHTLELLCHRLNEVLDIEFGNTSDESLVDRSEQWCKDLAEGTDELGDDDPRALLAGVVASVAMHWAAKGAVEANQVVTVLRRFKWPVFRRLEVNVLARVGPLMQEALDAVVGSAERVFEDTATLEYRLLLERQFANASSSAQQRHVEAIAKGPGTPEELRMTLTHFDDSPFTDADVERHIVGWQRKRIRRFGTAVPAVLQPLAEALAKHPRVAPPTVDEILLDDEGGFSRVYSRGGPTSPLSAEDIGKRTPEELLALFESFRPTGPSWDQPTPAGLARAVAEAVTTAPTLGLALARGMQTGTGDPTYVRAVLEGFLNAAEGGREGLSGDLFGLLRWAASRPRGGNPDSPTHFDYADANWDGAKRAAARLLRVAAQKKQLREEDQEEAWSTIEEFLRNPATWEGSARTREETVETVDASLMVALNHLGGDVAEALMQVALWTYRLNVKEYDPSRLRRAVDGVLQQTGREGVGAHTMLGKYLPWLLLLDQKGMLERAPELFAGGFTPPATNPVWGGYITAQRFFPETFDILRPWYVQATNALPTDRSGGAEKGRTWSPTRHLLSHLVSAVLYGHAKVSDDDNLIVIAFSRAPVSDIGHALWEVYRGWTDKGERPEASLVARLLDFWRWRLDVLEAASESVERAEEAGMLGWLALIPSLTDAEVLPLLARTTSLARGRLPMDHSLWPRLTSCSTINVSATFGIAEQLIRTTLNGEYPFLDADDVTPVLQAALVALDKATRERAYDLVNELGEKNFTQFSSLLPKRGASPAA